MGVVYNTGAVARSGESKRVAKRLRGGTSIESVISVALVALVGLGGFGVLGDGFARGIGDEAAGSPQYAAAQYAPPQYGGTPGGHAQPMATSQQAAVIPIGAVDQFAARAARVSDPFALVRKAALSESPTLRGLTGTADEIRASVGGYVEDLASRVNTETAKASNPEKVAAARSQLLRTAFSGDADGFASAMDGLGKALGKRTKPPLSPELMQELEGLTRILEPSGIRTFRNSQALSGYWLDFRTSESGRKSIERILANRERLIDSVAKILEPDQELERLRWVPMASNTESRAQLLEALDLDFTARSTAVRNRIRSGNPADARFDVVYVGAGPHSASAAYTVAHTNPAVSQLVVEAANVVGGNFRVGGDTFFLNSVTRMENTSMVRRPGGDVNLNPVAGPVGVPDFSGIKFPVASNMADVTAISLAASDADVLLQTRVSKVTRAATDAPAQYKVEFASGDVVFTDRVVFGSGFGKSKVNLGDEATARFLEAETAKAGGQIQTFDQWRDEFTKAEFPRDRYRAAQGAENVLVVGFGDSARVTIEALLGEGPEQLYRNDPAQAGAVGEITWLVGKDGPGTADEYLTGCNDYPGSRCRYSDITGAIRRLERTPEERVNEAVRLRQERVETMFRGVDGRIYVNGDMSRGYDRVITTTGYRSQLPEILNEIPSFESLEQLKRVELDVPGIGDVGENAAVAKKVADEEIYFIGPAAGTDLVAAQERVGIGENGAALFALIPRTNALATQRLSTAGRSAPVAQPLSNASRSILERGQQEFRDTLAPYIRVRYRGVPEDQVASLRVNIELEREADRPFIVNGTVRPVEPLLPTENSVYDGLGRQRGDQTVQTLRGSLSRAKALFDEDAGLESVSFSGSVRDGFSVVEKRNGVTRQVLSATNNEVVGPTQLDPAAAAGVLPRAEAAVIAGMVRDTILAKFERELVKDFSAADLKGREEVYVGVGINSLGLDYLSAILYEPGGAGNGGLGATFGRGQGGPPKFSFGGTGVRGSQSRAVTDAEKAAFTRLDEDLLGVPSLDLTREAKRRLDYVFRRRPGGQYDVQSVQFVDGNTADEIARYDFVERPAPFSPAVVKDSKRLARQAASVARRRERDYGQFLAPNGPSRPSLADATALRVSLIGESTLPSVVALADAGDALYAGDLLVETTPSLRELSARGIDELVFKYTRPDGRYELQSITAVRAGGGTEEIFSSADAVKYERFPGTRTN